MSAFCDIWIGQGAPSTVRKGNADWKSCEETGYSLSFPQDTDVSFVSETTVGKYKLVVLGQFYEAIELALLLQQCTRFVERKEASFNDPAGNYILFLFDSDSKDHYVFTNRFGTYHAYWSKDSKGNAISTYYLGMARQSHEKSLDWEGITGFFGMGFFPGTKTYLKEIQILAPASYYHFDASLSLKSFKRYWNWTISSKFYNEDDHYEKLSEAIGDSLFHAVNGHTVSLPISGGLDSRMLAGIISSKKLDYSSLWAYSYGYSKTSAETAIARRIAKARNIPFHASVVSNYLFKKIPEIAEAVELFQYVDGTRQADVSDAIAANAKLVVGGHWGDVWMEAMPAATESDLLPAFENKVLKRGSQWLLSEIVKNFQTDPGSYLREYFALTIKQYDHLENADLRFKAYKTDQWSFRWTLASIRMYQAAAFPVLPFYDKNVADLLLAIPADKLQGRKMQIEFIKKYHPDLARITWQEYGRDLYSYKFFNNRNIVYRVAEKVQRVVNGEKPITRNWEVFYMNPDGRKDLESHLLSNILLNDFVSKGKIEQLISEFYRNPSGANGYTVSMLLTFSEALKQIFD